MSDIHVLGGDGLGKWTVVLHFPVAVGNNNAAVSYRTALVNSGRGGTTALTEGTGPGEISTAELGDIQAGEVYEHSVSFLAESGATDDAEMWSEVQALFAREQTPTLDWLKKRLRYYGKSGSAT